MLHLLSASESHPAPQPYAEAVARLAGIRHALRLVAPHGGGPAADPQADELFGQAWQATSPARRRCCDSRSERVITATAAGLEALLAERGEQREPNPAASRRLADEIRAGLEEIGAVLRDAPAPALPNPIAL